MELLSFSKPLVPVTVIKRPSAVIKSPYVADIRYEDGRTGLCHTPGLGCSGMVETGKVIYVTASSESAKTDCTAQIARCEDSDGMHYVGVHPMISQNASDKILKHLYPEISWNSEVTVEEGTRLDYVGHLTNGKKMYVEVKNAMVALDLSVQRCERRALFPEGYRKKKDDPISPRAVKHAEILTRLAGESDTEKCMLLFIVSRDDCGDGMTINRFDPVYYSAIQTAVRAGVIIRAFSLAYSLEGKVTLGREVPFYIDF